MPQRAARPCAQPGCPATQRDGRQFCEVHRRQYETARGSAAKRGYGHEWQRLRRLFLNAHPLCVDPFKDHPGQVVAASEVDHKIPKARGGTNAWDNLQALCKPCHSKKTLTVDMRKG